MPVVLMSVPHTTKVRSKTLNTADGLLEAFFYFIFFREGFMRLCSAAHPRVI